MDPTRTASWHEDSPRATPRRGALFVAHHPDPARVGEHLAFDDVVVLGRRGADWPQVLDDRHLSRRHAEVTLHRDQLQVRDLGSRNGTRVDGERVEHAVLRPGSVLALGSLLLVAQRVTPDFRPASVPGLVGTGPAWTQLLQRVDRVAARSTSVLLLGPPGVGKERLARAVHERSGRSGSFVAVDCGAMADGVLHSELFGHARGAFSGAAVGRDGLVRSAAGGTLFLDEIGDASPSLQGALLRLLQEGEVRSVGSDAPAPVDVRCVAATNRDLVAAVAGQTFRQDLLDRLERVVIEVPPLAERREDVGLLALSFARRHAERPVTLEHALAEALVMAPWPGNVRQLDATLESVVIDAPDADALPLHSAVAARLQRGTESRRPEPPRPGRPTRAVLLDELRAAGGKVAAVAKAREVGRSTVYRWIDELQIDLAEFKVPRE